MIFFLRPIVIFLFLGFCFGSALSQDKLKSNDQIPIVAWIGVPERETTLERFREMRDAGINISFASYSNIEAVEKALNIAQQAGIKLQPYCPELKAEPEKTAKRLMKYPALAGYHLRDEPNATDFPELSTWIKRIQSVDTKHYCYINLFPNYASQEQLFGDEYQKQPGKDIYAAHVDTFLRQVPVPFISFDHYPVMVINGVRTIRNNWYKNLEIIAAAGKKYNLPFWAFALSVAHWDYPVPAIEEIRLQMFSNLAYGAQGLQYFTYWNPGPVHDDSWDPHNAPIGADGKRTDVYDRIKIVNKEIQALSGVFHHARLISVAHTGKKIPAGTIRLSTLPAPIKVLETGDGESIVSVLEKDNRQFLVIVNRSLFHPMKLTLVGDEKVKRVLKDGTLVAADAYNPTLEIAPGDMLIYCWQKN